MNWLRKLWRRVQLPDLAKFDISTKRVAELRNAAVGSADTLTIPVPTADLAALCSSWLTLRRWAAMADPKALEAQRIAFDEEKHRYLSEAKRAATQLKEAVDTVHAAKNEADFGHQNEVHYHDALLKQVQMLRADVERTTQFFHVLLARKQSPKRRAKK